MISIGIAILLGAAFVFASRQYNPKGTTRKMSVDYFRTATSTSLTIVGLLTPILVAVLSYLYLKQPSGNYSVLLAVVVLLYIVLVLAVWATFAILRKAKGDSVITLSFPADRKYITSMGLLYSLQLLALVLFAYFFLIDFPRTHAGEAAVQTVGGRLLLRPAIAVGTSRSEVLRVWGPPASATARSLTYSTGSASLVVQLDQTDHVSAIIELGEGKESK